MGKFEKFNSKVKKNKKSVRNIELEIEGKQNSDYAMIANTFSFCR